MKLQRNKNKHKSGSYFTGSKVGCTKSELETLFGKAEYIVDDRTHYEWRIVDENGNEFCIYDYRGDEWHIGAHDASFGAAIAIEISRMLMSLYGIKPL